MKTNWEKELNNLIWQSEIFKGGEIKIKQFIKDLMLTTLDELKMKEKMTEIGNLQTPGEFVRSHNEIIENNFRKNLNQKIEDIKKNF